MTLPGYQYCFALNVNLALRWWWQIIIFKLLSIDKSNFLIIKKYCKKLTYAALV